MVKAADYSGFIENAEGAVGVIISDKAMFLQASSVRENSADVVGTTCNTLLCRQKSLPFALRDAKGMKSFSFFLLKKILLSGNFFSNKTN